MVLYMGDFQAGTAGFIYTLLVILLSSGIARATSVSMALVPTSLSGASGIVTASA